MARDFASPGTRGSVGEDEVAQQLEPDRPRAEDAGVEVLERERRALLALHVLAQLEDGALPDLVRDGLARPAEVARDLGRGVGRVLESALLHQLDAQRVRPLFAR